MNAFQKNKGKLATTGGGLSLFLAIKLFATKAEVEMLRDRLAEEHRDAMDREQECVGRFAALVRPTNGLTAKADSPKVQK